LQRNERSSLKPFKAGKVPRKVYGKKGGGVAPRLETPKGVDIGEWREKNDGRVGRVILLFKNGDCDEGGGEKEKRED